MRIASVWFVIAIMFMACQEQDKKGANALSGDKPSETPQNDKPKVVSLCNSVSETLYFLGCADEVVGVDITSQYPEQFKEKANLGHYPNFNVEAIVALNPDIVFARRDEVKEELTAQLEKVGIELVLFEQEYSVAGTKAVIDLVAERMGKVSLGSKLKNKIDSTINTIEPLERSLDAIYIYSRSANAMLVAGTNNQLNGLIELAGANNAMAMFEGYKPITSEGLVKANPDVVVVFNKAVQMLGGIEPFLNINGMSETIAGKEENIISVDGLLAGSFGPRLGDAVKELNQKMKQVVEEE